MKLYGIKNCNSVKKGCEFLQNLGLKYDFCDIKKLDEATLKSWLEQKALNELINSSGLSAKKLGLNKEKIINLMQDPKGVTELERLILQSPSLIKRPVIESKGKVYVGLEYEKIRA